MMVWQLTSRLAATVPPHDTTGVLAGLICESSLVDSPSMRTLPISEHTLLSSWAKAAPLWMPCAFAGVAGADIVMHVREGNPKDPNECTASTFASARGCDWDPVTMRPTVGEITVCNLFSQTAGEAGATITHEVLHALVGVSHTD